MLTYGFLSRNVECTGDYEGFGCCRFTPFTARWCAMVDALSAEQRPAQHLELYERLEPLSTSCYRLNAARVVAAPRMMVRVIPDGHILAEGKHLRREMGVAKTRGILFMGEQFELRELRLLDSIEEVEIETVPSNERDAPQRKTIWIVAVESGVYVRSVNGKEGHWYQEVSAKPVSAKPVCAIYADDQRIPVHAVPVSDARTQLQVSEAYQRKYAFYPQDVAWITRPEVLPTTLRLEPNPA